MADAHDRSVRLTDLGFLPQIGLRLDAGDAASMAAVAGVLGLTLPSEPCRVAREGQRRALWLGPDEWLVVAPGDDAGRLIGALEQALAGRHAAVLDLSWTRTVLEISGPDAQDTLEAGCLLDLHRSVFAAGTVAGTILAKSQVYLERETAGDGADVFRIYVRASFAEHMRQWLARVMAV
ncbi:MAG: sarcosine oxidase subunit gamma [Hyphomicrobiaceae bacterium]|nr:sarcosine oxidase subunit gamma [Hyphomicrobiaceae bacterium]